MAENDPALTAEHAKLIRHFRVTWVPIESGAPGIDAEFPFGPEVDVIARALALLDTNDRRLAVHTMAEAARMVPAYLDQCMQLVPGNYPMPADMLAYFASADSGFDANGNFMLRAAHMGVLKGANWRVVDGDAIDEVLACEPLWPMPYIDGKRPYVNSCYFQIDMAKLLGEPYAMDAQGQPLADQDKDERLEQLHYETLAALQILLTHG